LLRRLLDKELFKEFGRFPVCWIEISRAM